MNKKFTKVNFCKYIQNVAAGRIFKLHKVKKK